MKRLLLIPLLFLTCIASSHSQSIQVTVTSDGEPLSFSYVYINGNPFGSVGENGITYIPQRQLHRGDTISASFVGYNNAMVIYEGPQTRKYTIDMTQNTTIEKISVFGKKQARVEFRKYTNSRAPLTSMGTFEADILFRDSGRNIQHIGTWAHNFRSGRTVMYFELHKNQSNIAILKNDDNREYISKSVLPLLKDAYYTAARSAVTMPEYISESKTGVRFLGTESDQGRVCRMFLLSRMGNGKSADKVLSSQIILAVDSTSHEHYFADIEILRPDGKIDALVYYKTYKQLMIPAWVDATYTMNDGRSYSISIRNTRVTHNDRPRIFEKKLSVSSYAIDDDLFDWATDSLILRSPVAIEVAKRPTPDFPPEEMWEKFETIALLNSVY